MWWWWITAAVLVLLVTAYMSWLAARLGRLHRRAEAAAAALDAALVRRAAAAAVLADQLIAPASRCAAELYTAARVALDAVSTEREPAENDLTMILRSLPQAASAGAHTWPAVVTASRRVSLAKQVHTDVVRDALRLRRRIPVRLFGLARRLPEPGYFEVDDPGLDAHPASSRPPGPDWLSAGQIRGA